MTSAPNRRWFRFRLRTLFVMVTVFGCSLAWNLPSVRARHEALQWCYSACAENAPGKRHEIPISWRLLGAEPVWCLVITREVSREEAARLGALFPEAGIL